MHSVKVDRDRPDFRVFIELLYGPDWNVDSDGNSVPVSSRTWTWLYLSDRKGASQPVEITESDDEPSIFRVESKSDWVEELAALYLFLYSGTAITKDLAPLNADQVADMKAQG